jgi:RNA ligase (TIGR02306 family)
LRKLASVQIIRKLSPIKDADRIELAHIEGFQCVVPKGYHVGDKVIYIETDSICPKNETFVFLKGHSHIKLQKIRGVYSQGIALEYHGDAPVGTDMTEELGIVKYEPPEQPMDTVGAFPWYVPKTDEVRAQNIPELLTKYKGIPCYATEKLDGSSCTIYRSKGHIGVCTRKREVDSTSPMFRTAERQGLLDFISNLDKDIAIQGEFVGPKQQGNHLHLPEHHIYVFSVYDITKQGYFDQDTMDLFLNFHNVDTVPLVNEFALTDNIDELVGMAIGNSTFGNFPREGIVIRPVEPIEGLQGFPGSRFSFKVINPEYQMKRGE